MSKEQTKNLFLSLSSNISDEKLQLSVLQGLIAAEISMRRQNLGLSQQQLAEKMGVSQALVSRWETGDVNFTLSSLVKISFALDLSLQSPIVPSPPLCYTEHGNNITHISSAPGWAGSVYSSSCTDNYTVEQDLELKEN